MATNRQVQSSRIDIATTTKDFELPQVLPTTKVAELGLDKIVFSPLIQYTDSIMKREDKGDKEWCEPSNGDDPTTFPDTIKNQIMSRPTEPGADDAATIKLQPPNADMFVCLLCVAHNAVRNFCLPKDVLEASPFVSIHLLDRCWKLLLNFLAMICIQYATNFSLRSGSVTTINKLPPGHWALAMLMADELVERFGRVLPMEDRSYTFTSEKLAKRGMKSFLGGTLTNLKANPVWSVNWAYNEDRNLLHWNAEWASGLPFHFAYFVRQTVKGFDEHFNSYENVMRITEKEKKMLRDQPVYCQRTIAPAAATVAKV
mgnify:CR=1 FL=1